MPHWRWAELEPLVGQAIAATNTEMSERRVLVLMDKRKEEGMAATRNGYTLTDRPSWLRFRNRGRLTILVQDDPRLVVQFGVMAVNPAKHPGVHAAAAKAFIEWLSSKDGQDAILQFKVQDEVPYLPNYGERGG